LKYAGIHMLRISNMCNNHLLFSSSNLVIKNAQVSSNSFGVSEPQTHDLKLLLNSSSSFVDTPTFSETFFMICHMHILSRSIKNIFYSHSHGRILIGYYKSWLMSTHCFQELFKQPYK